MSSKHINPNSLALLLAARNMFKELKNVDMSPQLVERIDKWLDSLERFLK